jgi:cell division inhibitor SulA/protein ImuA
LLPHQRDGGRTARLLEHPAIWRTQRGTRDAAQRLARTRDEYLPGGGWPRSGLTEILVVRFGSGELQLLLPTLAALTRALGARWCVGGAPAVPFCSRLVSQAVLERGVVGGARPLWAFEQVLGSGGLDAALGWCRDPQPRDIRRLRSPPSAEPWGCCSRSARRASPAQCCA